MAFLKSPSDGFLELAPRTFVVTFTILLCALGIYVAVALVWLDSNSAKKSGAEYDLAMADLRADQTESERRQLPANPRQQ